MSAAPTELVEARLQLHHGVQLLAAFGQMHVPAREDDSHRSMTWDPEARVFVSEATVGEGPSVQAWFRSVGLMAGVRTDGEYGSGFSLIGHTLDESYAALSERIAGVVGGPGGAPLGRPEYEMPHHAVLDGAEFTGGPPGHLGTLTEAYSEAYQHLERIVRTREDVTPVRCWPHHFDLAVLMLLDPEKGAEVGRSIGVGLSPGDQSYAEPYWYVTPHPAPEGSELPGLPSGGHWHTDGWLGGILTASAVQDSSGDSGREVATEGFLAAAIAAARDML